MFSHVAHVTGSQGLESEDLPRTPNQWMLSLDILSLDEKLSGIVYYTDSRPYLGSFLVFCK